MINKNYATHNYPAHADGKRGNMPDIEKELIKYKKEKANIIGPEINLTELSKFHKIVIDSVKLSIDAASGDTYKHADAYKGKPAQYIISGKGLQKLAVCAGITWDPVQTRVTSISHRYVACTAVGFLRKSDGTTVGYPAESDIDIDVAEDEINDNYLAKAESWAKEGWFKKLGVDGQNAYIEGKKRKELNFRKKHKTKIAATDARSRVIRALLMTKKTYTTDELKEPFVFPRVILAPDYSDPEVKKMMLQASIASMTNVFGQAPTTSIIANETIDIPAENYDVRSVQDEDTDEHTEPPFEDLQRAEQVSMLASLAVSKKYDTSAMSVGFDEMDSRNRERFYTHLIALEV